MQKLCDTLLTQADPITGAVKPLQGAQVFVYQGDSQILANIYQDNETTQKTNPLTSDAAGFYECKVPNGKYDIYVVSGTIVKKVPGLCAFDGNQSAITITMPPQYAVSGGVNVAWVKQAANKVLAGPSNGPDADPAFRSLSMADLPFTGTATADKFLRGDGVWAAVPAAISTKFESAELTITTAGALTVPHSLAVAPKFLYGVLVCKTAEAGYAAGDELSVPIAYNGAAAATSVAVVVDTTNIKIRFASSASVFQALNFSTGNGVGLTNGNWRLKLRAYA